jgi:hypothetical protein
MSENELERLINLCLAIPLGIVWLVLIGMGLHGFYHLVTP